MISIAPAPCLRCCGTGARPSCAAAAEHLQRPRSLRTVLGVVGPRRSVDRAAVCLNSLSCRGSGFATRRYATHRPSGPLVRAEDGPPDRRDGRRGQGARPAGHHGHEEGGGHAGVDRHVQARRPRQVAAGQGEDRVGDVVGQDLALEQRALAGLEQVQLLGDVALGLPREARVIRNRRVAVQTMAGGAGAGRTRSPGHTAGAARGCCRR